MANAQVIKEALAEYFECDVEDIGGFVVGCERSTGGRATFSSAYSSIPHWYLFGFLEELRSHFESLRMGAQLSDRPLEASLNEYEGEDGA
jgi:hypothetical protein